MKLEEHKARLLESLSVIDECIEKGVTERQRNIGFNTSAAAVDMFEIFLHKNNLIDPGFVIKHEWFNSANKVRATFSYDFSHKKEIIALMSKIEGKRNVLCYGRTQQPEVIGELLRDFNVLRNLMKGEGIDEHE